MKEKHFLDGVKNDFPPPTGDKLHDDLNRLQARSDRSLARPRTNTVDDPTEKKPKTLG